MKGLNRLAASVFVLFAVLQCNDPDPILWVVAYALAGCACMVWERGGLSRSRATALAFVALGSAALVAGAGPEALDASAALSDWQMMSVQAEVAREVGGLLVVGSWMMVLAWRRPE